MTVRTSLLPMPDSLPHAPSPASDETIAAAARGEPAAVGALYDAHHRPVRVPATRLLGDPAAAEDLVHDVFVALPRALARFEGRAQLRTFVLSITVNLARKKVRSLARRRAAMKRLADQPAPPGDGDPEGAHRRRRLAEALDRALAALPEAQREAFVLCVVEERSSTEVAEILEVPEGTVRTRLFHARKKLRAMLEGPGFGAGEA